MISLTCNNADFYDTSTISGQKENKKEKQTTEGEVGQSSVTEEQLTFLINSMTKTFKEHLAIFENVLNIWHVQMV